MQKIKTTFPLWALSKIFVVSYDKVLEWMDHIKREGTNHPKCPGWMFAQLQNVIWQHKAMSEGRMKWVDGYDLYV